MPDSTLLRTASTDSASAVGSIEPAHPLPAWDRYVALGDSLTEGLSDPSRTDPATFRGWADRLAMLLAHERATPEPLRYANLAVRSRRIADVIDVQLPRAIDLGADLVSVLVGGNDLMLFGADPRQLSARLTGGITRLRDAGCDVLVVTPFTPPHSYLRGIQEHFERFNRGLRDVARGTDCILLDFWDHAEFRDSRMWSTDRVHLSAQGHRALAYRAAGQLGVPGARELGALDIAMHEAPPEPEPPLGTVHWIWSQARPWIARRARGRTAGDGLSPKHWVLEPVLPKARPPS